MAEVRVRANKKDVEAVLRALPDCDPFSALVIVAAAHDALLRSLFDAPELRDTVTAGLAGPAAQLSQMVLAELTPHSRQ